MESQDVILTVKEAESLRATEAGQHLCEEVKHLLTKSRLELDTVSVDRLPTLQGRISAVKDILNILGADYE
jgi:hypothetical protein